MRTGILVLACFLFASPAEPSIVQIELTPTDVGSLSATTFSTLPSESPDLFFGISFLDVRTVNFDLDEFGTPLPHLALVSTQYQGLGVTMNNIEVRSTVSGGPASPPNATFSGFDFAEERQIFDFIDPVAAVGFINTSPDTDLYEFFDAAGSLLLSFRDGGGSSTDRFVGALADGGARIAQVVVTNHEAKSDLELDELAFAVSEPATVVLFATGLADS